MKGNEIALILITWDIALQKKLYSISYQNGREGNYFNMKYSHKIIGKMIRSFIYFNLPALKTIQASICLITIQRAMEYNNCQL